MAEYTHYRLLGCLLCPPAADGTMDFETDSGTAMTDHLVAVHRLPRGQLGLTRHLTYHLRFGGGGYEYTYTFLRGDQPVMAEQVGRRRVTQRQAGAQQLWLDLEV